MATHSSILFAWRIPWTEEPGGLRSQRVAQGLKRLRPPAEGLQDPTTVQEALTSLWMGGRGGHFGVGDASESGGGGIKSLHTKGR